jgi:hypothetical protein
MMNYFPVCLTLLILWLAAPRAGAQVNQGSDEPPQHTSLINLDGPRLLERGMDAGRLDVRAFGGKEDLVYSSLSARVGLGHDWEGAVWASVAGRKSLLLPGGSAIRHGGSDVELLARYRFLREGLHRSGTSLTGLIGVALPDTPARTSAALTLGLSATNSPGRRVAFTLNPRVAFLDNNTLFGVGLGVQLRLGGRISLIGDYTPLLTGDNTRDTTSGALMHRDLYGVAIRYSAPEERLTLDLGFTNGTGATTGFSLTPGLGGSGAIYLAIGAHR